MTAMPQERKDGVLIVAIGLSIVLVVLVVGYLAYQSLPATMESTDSTALPTSYSAAQSSKNESLEETSSGQPDASGRAPVEDSRPAGGDSKTSVEPSTAGDSGTSQPGKEG